MKIEGNLKEYPYNFINVKFGYLESSLLKLPSKRHQRYSDSTDPVGLDTFLLCPKTHTEKCGHIYK